MKQDTPFLSTNAIPDGVCVCFGVCVCMQFMHSRVNVFLLTQGGAPELAKLVYNSHNYGLWQI